METLKSARTSFRRLLRVAGLGGITALVILFLLSSAFAGIGFQPVSPDELKMTAEPLAPGAPAIILYRQVDRDDNGRTSHQDDYFRIKILTEEGRMADLANSSLWLPHVSSFSKGGKQQAPRSNRFEVFV